MTSKINPGHLARRAIVYLRQSTLKQVFEHRESTDRQYGLQARALDLGWAGTRFADPMHEVKWQGKYR